ncbi:hypothetical protein TRVA0_020S01904 [Trichomonascus vanleenenianus]|uniref:uncharacterized protein n=1 Tax=Trichomonascus vanleenenianus TaxID=2268995 RepID=UPI003ECB7962
MSSKPPLKMAPAPLKPAPIAQKPIAAAPKPALSPAPTPGPSSPTADIQLSTSKVWVLPPRPKPGRKPSVDTPPTKRKAQNRAAQRAFRERRAARVGELEEKLAAVESDRAVVEQNYKAEIKRLRSENSDLRRTVQELRTHSYGVSTPMASPVPGDDDDLPLDVLDRALEERLPVSNSSAAPSDIDDCRVCVKDDCICVAIGIREKPMIPSSPEQVRSVPLKKRKISPPEDTNTMEIDFTEMFSRPKKVKSVPLPPRAKKMCGFCGEEQPCMCERNTLAPLAIPSPPESVYSDAPESPVSPRKLPTLHPDIQEVLPVTYSSPLANAAPIVEETPSTGCTGNPGNCMQCRSDPMSTLFCTTIAERNKKQGAALPTSTQGGTYIPCAAAYQTLSRHKDFYRADLGRLVGKLNTRGMQVEVSSVANVLRELDRRLYE